MHSLQGTGGWKFIGVCVVAFCFVHVFCWDLVGQVFNAWPSLRHAPFSATHSAQNAFHVEGSPVPLIQSSYERRVNERGCEEYNVVEMMRGIKKMCMKNQHQFDGLRACA
jgi:hypothetical protein